MGGIQGAALLSVDRSISAGVLNSPGGGGDLTIASLSPLPVGRPTLGGVLASRVPSLLNVPGLTSVGDVPVGPPLFNENVPLRGEGPVLNTVDGATDIQQLLDNTEWVGSQPIRRHSRYTCVSGRFEPFEPSQSSSSSREATRTFRTPWRRPS